VAKIDWKEALSSERDVAILIHEQEQSGIYFDMAKALYYIALLEKMKGEKYSLIRPHLNYEVIKGEKLDKETGEYSFVRKVYLKDGRYNSQILSHYDDPSIVCGPFSRIQIEEPSISKRGLIINQLLKYGWKPTEFTEKGSPKLTEKGEPVDTLDDVGTFGKDLSLWYIYAHRQSQIRGFLPHVRSDGRIPAGMNTCATNTFRAAHRVVANIPRPTSVFGKEMRSLFRVPDGRKFVGADESGLELRILAHHMRDPEYINQILKGDIHLYNLSLTGDYIYNGVIDFSDIPFEKKRLAQYRDIGKTWIYGFIYGCGDDKSGRIIGKGKKEGKKLKQEFFKRLPALVSLIDKIKIFVEKHGFIPSIDNRKIRIRQFEGRYLLHTALNAKLQADGSILTKKAMVFAADEIKRRGLDAFQIIFYHDEFGYDCSEECADEVGKILIESMKKAGEFYNLRIPIDGEYAIGMDWGVH
jgi:hypothetical protein